MLVATRLWAAMLAGMMLAGILPALLPVYAQTDDTVGSATDSYTIHIPDVMIRGESYRGVIVSALPADGPTVFRLGASPDLVLDDAILLEPGSNHAVFDITPVDSTILSGVVSTEVTVILPDGTIQAIQTKTHPGVGVVSRLWMVGPGAQGVSCERPGATSSEAISDRAADGAFDLPDPAKEVRTRLSGTSLHMFLTDRYCTPVAAPAGGVGFSVSSDTPALTFGGGRTHLTGVIPQGYNSAILDVGISDAGGGGIIYGTGTGVAPDAIRIENEPIGNTIHLGVGPSIAMESSYVHWYVWMERNGEQYIPDDPLSVYLTTDNPVLASFEQNLVDKSGPVFQDIRPYHTHMVDGIASGVIHTGTPAGVGDLRLLAGDREIRVTAHIPGYGSATTQFQVGMPGAASFEFQVNVDQLQECMKEEGSLPDGFYSAACTKMWQRLLVASHFFDIRDQAGEYLDSPDDTIQFLDRLFGGDNTASGNALYTLVSTVNEYSILGPSGHSGGLADELSDLLGIYMQASGVDLQRVDELGLAAEMLQRMPEDLPPNRIALETFPGTHGKANVVISTYFDDGEVRFPVYMPDGVITLSGDSGVRHPAEVRTYGSNPRPDAPGTRPSSVVIPVDILGGGTLTASLGGVGSNTIQIRDMAPSGGKRLHVETLPGGGERDLIAIISVLDSDGLVTGHAGDIYVEAGQGASGVELVGWRGGGGMVRGSVEGVGEIVIHAPGLGGGTALTTPVRHEAELHIWHPDVAHVAEEFPLVAHTLDADGLPVGRVHVEVAGKVDPAGTGIELREAGHTPIIVEHMGMFYTGQVTGFLNHPDVRVDVDSLVELNDTITIHVDTGVMRDPSISIDAGPLLFSGERDTWETSTDIAGDHTILINVNTPGWETYTYQAQVTVSNLLDVQFDAVTNQGTRLDVTLEVCGHTIRPDATHTMQAQHCEVSVPANMEAGGIRYGLTSLEVDGRLLQPGATYDFTQDGVIHATYQGEILVEVTGVMPDGTNVEMFWGELTPGDLVSVSVEPQYELWGLIWDRPARYDGVPPDGVIHDGVVQWTAADNETIVVQYERDLTYLVMVGAAALAVPVLVLLRHRIRGLSK